MPEMKGITVKIPADLHAEVKAYLEAHGMTMGEFIAQAVDNELHPKIQITQEDKNMERTRTLAFQVPDSLFQRVKAYLERNHMSQKQFVIGLIEAELEQKESRQRNRRTKKNPMTKPRMKKQRKKSRPSLAPRRPRKAPTPGWRNDPSPTRTPPPWTVLRPVPKMGKPSRRRRKKPKSRAKKKSSKIPALRNP